MDGFIAERSEADGGVRTVCDLNLVSVTEVVSSNAWVESLEPGDIVAFKTADNWLSRTISSLDGYWTHSSIYVGEGQIAHAGAAGIGMAPLVKLVEGYEECVGYARPSFGLNRRRAAAEWATKVCTGDGRYSGGDLGLAFALLVQAKWRAALMRLPFLDSADRFDESDLESSSETLSFERTCSGFVYSAYAESGSGPLRIVPAPGIESKDGLLTARDRSDESLWHYFENVDVDLAEKQEGLGREDLRRWVTMTKLVGSAIASSTGFAFDEDQTLTIEQGVTPADLWCSPDIGERGFLSAAFKTAAHDASSGCVETAGGEEESQNG